MEKTFTGDEFLWSQFCRLGEMIGDGLADEPDGKWISREYKQTAIALGLLSKQKRKTHTKQIDEFMEKRVKAVKCECGGSFTQVRKGSFIGKCNACGKRVVLGRRTKKK